MNGEKSEKPRLRWLRAILSWVSRPISWLYRTLMDWRVWKDWPWWVKVIAIIWMLLPLPHLYEILKIWLPWIYPLLDEIGIRLPTPPQPELSQEEQDQSLFDQVRTSMLVVAAWYGVFFLIWRTVLADRQTQAADKQTEINRESHYTELFAKAVEQLGATRQDGEPAIEMRIGAIFALERLAKDSERDYGPIIETLAAYIREHCRDPKSFDGEDLIGEDFNEAWQAWIESLRENPPANRSDVAAVLTVLSRRKKNRNWTNTSEDETQPDFTGTNFQSANLEYANLSDTKFLRADLSDATLWEANLLGANLEMTSLLGASLEKANLSGAYLVGANLEGANLNEADLSGASLVMVNLSDTRLISANMSDTSLFSADLSGANLRGTDLSGANLTRVDLWGVNLWGADLSGTKLRGAYLEDTTLGGANLAEADFEGALLAGAQLKDSKGLTDDMIKKAFGDENTSLPTGLSRPAHWNSQEEAIEKWEAFREEEWHGFHQSLWESVMIDHPEKKKETRIKCVSP